MRRGREGFTSWGDWGPNKFAANFNWCLTSLPKPAFNSMLVWWGGNTRKSDAKWLNRLVRKADSVVGTELESLTSATIKRTLNRVLSIMDNDCQPFHNKVSRQRGMFSSRLLWPAQETGYEGPLFCGPFSSTMLQQKGRCELDLFAWVCTFFYIMTAPGLPLHFDDLHVT